MLKIKTAFIAFTVLIGVEAACADGPTTQEDIEGLCANISEMAASTMRARQNGVPMSQLIELVNKGEPMIKDAAKAIIVDAYSRPRFSTPDYVSKEVQDFQNDNYLNCIKIIKVKKP